MRRRKADLSARVNGDLHVDFSGDHLTSFAGLELLLRYLRKSGFNAAIRKHLKPAGLGGDFGAVAMVHLVIGLVIVGGRRMEHLVYLKGDPLFLRFAGLAQLPGPRSLSRWLKRFKASSVAMLQRLNAAITAPIIRQSSLRTLTIDVDGTVISTGLQVERAFRGFNPHHRNVPSYYPITAYLPETGHMLRVQNRSGNVEDGKGSLRFLRDLFRQMDEMTEGKSVLRFRMDGAFFKDAVLRILEQRKAGYAIKVPFYQWLNLQTLILPRRRWNTVGPGISCFETILTPNAWNRSLRVVIYRKRVHHPTRKNYQLNLFDPDDGTYEYSAVTTNLDLSAENIWWFMAGRGVHEKALGQLKSGLAFATVPTNHYGANSAWQQLVVLAHNVLTNFQIETIAEKRPRSKKRTGIHLLRSAQTLRFELINRAGEIVRPDGRTILRIGANKQVQQIVERIVDRLAQAA
jgi:hypothetical protein